MNIVYKTRRSSECYVPWKGSEHVIPRAIRNALVRIPGTLRSSVVALLCMPGLTIEAKITKLGSFTRISIGMMASLR